MSLSSPHYSVTKIAGAPLIGCTWPLVRDPLKFTLDASANYGDIICFNVMGKQMVQINHPDLIRYVLIENHKNYKKNVSYIRFESVGGLGLLTSHGEKWKRDRKKIQPLFSRELILKQHYLIANEVSEKYKRRWLELTRNGASAEIDLLHEMSSITTEIIIKAVFGRDIGDETVSEIHQAYNILIDYLKNIRIFPNVDLRKHMGFPSYFRFKAALDKVDAIIGALSVKYRGHAGGDRNNMFALLLDAQKNDPDHFDDREIRDQCVTMIFAGFETTSILLQWMWYLLDDHKNIRERLRSEITAHAPLTASEDSSKLEYESIHGMEYLSAFFKETLRLYPSFWVTGREPIEDDRWGDFIVKKGTAIALPQYAIHRCPKWWDRPNDCLPERFLPLSEKEFDEGIYFPFSHGPRRCSGYFFAEMEAKTVIAKILPLFNIELLNKAGNPLLPGISLQLKHDLIARISRA